VKLYITIERPPTLTKDWIARIILFNAERPDINDESRDIVEVAEVGRERDIKKQYLRLIKENPSAERLLEFDERVSRLRAELKTSISVEDVLDIVDAWHLWERSK
jgi:transcription initiation factor TFIIIB Brf1 subunit/transcription initiation factor TFIIB